MRATNFYRATSIDDAYKKMLEDPRNTILAGGLWIKKMGQSYNTLIDISGLELNKISEDTDSIHVGAMVTLRDFEASPIVNRLFDGVTAFAVREIMGVNFRSLATIGGSIFGRYPFSDVIAGLLPLDVTLEFYPEQKMSLEEYLGYRGKLQAILVAVHIKKGKGKAFYKKVKATALDFPLINISVVKRDDHYYIAVGSRPLVASLAHEAMKEADSGEKFEKVAKTAVNHYLFADSMTIGKEYRKELAEVYIRRGLEEVSK